MRKLILSVLGVLILAGGIWAARSIISSNKRVRPKAQKVVKTVFTDTILNGAIDIKVQAKGNLVAKRRMELYAEVQGVLRPSRKLFKAGQTYRAGELLIRIDAAEYLASVKSQKSNLFNQITAIMPDLRLDYPDIYPKWQAYLTSFDIEKTIPPLPEMMSEAEKYFIGGRNITSSYYNVKNLEQRLSKYTIRAPYSGILTEALVTEGTLIRPGQKLGEYIDTDAYELQVAVNKSYADLLKIGKSVRVTNIEKTKLYEGVVSRINGNINQASQTIDAFIEVRDPSLREGVYMEAELDVREIASAIRINRSLLQPNDQIFIVRDTVLDLIDVQPVYFDESTVVLQGVPDGTVCINKMVPGAYAGMLVKVFQEQESSQENQEQVAIQPN